MIGDIVGLFIAVTPVAGLLVWRERRIDDGGRRTVSAPTFTPTSCACSPASR